MAKKLKLNKLATVNVIEMRSGILERIVSFKDTERGNKEAEKLFRSLIQNLNADVISEEDFDCFLNDAGIEIMISHSDTTNESI